jgi:hypothetical protein
MDAKHETVVIPVAFLSCGAPLQRHTICLANGWFNPGSIPVQGTTGVARQFTVRGSIS